MARAYLLSHGARIGNLADTFVPDDKSISFYSEFDENTLRTIGLAAVSAGDIEPTETFTGGEPVSNYYLVEFEDSAIAEHLAAESSQTGGRLYFTGSDLPSPTMLCTTPNECATTAPQHHPNCQGVFALVAEDEIYSVSCRGLSGGPSQGTREMEGSGEFMDDMGAEARRILEWAQTDPDAAMAYYQSLSEATRAMLTGASVSLETWAESYFTGGGTDTPFAIVEARNYLESHGDIAFADYADQWEAEQRSVAFDDDSLLEAYWIGTGRRTLYNEGAPAFWEWFRDLDTYWQGILTADSELADAVAAGAQGADLAETSEWMPTDADFEEAAWTNQVFVKELEEGVDATWEVGSFLVLLGDQGSGDLPSRVRQSHDYATGTFQVERATFGAGKLAFSDVPPMHQGTIESAIAGFSDKKVKFA